MAAWRASHPLRKLLPSVALVNVVASVVIRVVHRDSYVAGWEVAGAANGLFMVSTHSARELWSYYIGRQFDDIGWPVFGAPVSLLPGYLASRWPGDWWPQITTPTLVLISLLVLRSAIDLPGRGSWIMLLAWGASSALLSYSVIGFPYISSILPNALALFAVLRGRGSVLWALVGSLTAIELSWHVQELGRTIFAIFFAAAILLPRARPVCRVIWLAGGAMQFWLERTHPTYNTVHYAAMTLPPLSSVAFHTFDLLRHFGTLKPDIPLLIVAGILAAMSLGNERWFWCAVLGFHLGVIWLLASNSGILEGIGAVWPRRVLMLDFICVAACVAAVRARRRSAPIVISLLAVGCVWQFGSTVEWASKRLDYLNMGWAFPMPYTQTTLDCAVPIMSTDWFKELRATVDDGRKVLLLYNLTSFDENNTDPAGVIERLYLHLGHERFMSTVYVFGDDRIRWNELPIRPMSDVDSTLASLTPDEVEAYYLYHPNDDRADWPIAVKHQQEMGVLFDAVRTHFDVEWHERRMDVQGRVLMHFALRPHDNVNGGLAPTDHLFGTYDESPATCSTHRRASDAFAGHVLNPD